MDLAGTPERGRIAVREGVSGRPARPSIYGARRDVVASLRQVATVSNHPSAEG